jgi:hypothetical protein
MSSEMPTLSLPRPLHLLNEGLAFLIELVMLVASCAWAWRSADTTPGGVLRAAAVAIAIGLTWGAFASPKARVRLPLGGVLAVKVALFLLATLAIDALAGRGPAIAFAVVAIANATLAGLDREAAVNGRRDP